MSPRVRPAGVRSGRSGARGVTLVELLVVMAIISMMAALGVGVYIKTSASMKDEAAVAQVDAILRQVRNSVLSSGAPAFVEFNPAHNPPLVIPWTYRMVGLWHFEEEFGDFKGARKHTAHNIGCRKEDGKIGRGISCAKPDSLGASLEYLGYVEVETDGDFDLDDGGYLEAYIYPYGVPRGEQTIFKKKDCYYLTLGAGGVLIGRAGDKEVRVDPAVYRVAPQRWTKVAFSFDKNSSRILVDDFIVASGPGMRAKKNEESLQFSDEVLPFIGKIDEVKVLEAIPGNPLSLPPDTTLTHNADPWGAVFFAPDGTLDVRYHPNPIRVDIVKGTKRRSILISMLGTTHKLDVEDIRPKDEDDAGVNAPTAPIKGKPAAKPLLPALPARKKLPPSDDVKPPEDPTTLQTPEKPMENLPPTPSPDANPAGEMKDDKEAKPEDKP